MRRSMRRQATFRDKLTKLTGGWYFSVERVDDTHLVLSTDEDFQLTFAILQKLSEIFGTKMINIGAETRQDQYYPSTNPDSSVIISINDITQWPEY